ncbi:MAG: hypothetical protein ISS47_09630 [Candidatus Omnitrophica bacterium]|nr:hypothetical protein [Candidatus Omnitrophota bacterium]
MKEKRRFDLELKQIFSELKGDPLHKLNIAFALMSIIPILGFVYILAVKLFSLGILEGDVGFIVFVVILISLLGFFIVHILVKNLLARIISYMLRLKEYDRKKSIFVANVCHEIKNPLATLKLSISTISDDLAGKIDEEQVGMIKRNKDLCDRLIRFTTELLNISKIEAGKVELKKSQLELNKLVDELIKIFESSLNEKHIELMANRPFSKIVIWADSDKLSHAIFNLIDNAIKYTPVNGKVFISLHDENRYARIEIRDTGKGIPEGKIDKIFDRFQNITSKKGSVGLGLSIAKDFVELHKGRIWVESELNQGSKFIVLLPKDLRIINKGSI